MTLRDIKPQTALPFHGVLLPTIEITPEQRAAAGAKLDCTNLEFLTQLCRNGWKAKVAPCVPKDKWPIYSDRVKEEIGVIEFLGFTQYLLMVWDLCDYTDRQGIPRGPGRGSVAGSLIAHLIGLTTLDPVEHGLFFTRFLSKARAKSAMIDGRRYIDGSLVPDVDLDYSFYRRGDVITYLNQRYPGQTSKLLSTTTFSSKILIKDVLKVYENASEEQANEASSLIEKHAGIPDDIEVALYGDKKWRDGDEENGQAPNARFVEWAKKHEETVELAMELADLNRGEGQHASAVLVAHTKITDIMPLQLSSEKELISAYDMHSAQDLVIKLDVLGLRTLDATKEACGLIGMNPEDIDIHHPSIYAYLQDFKLRYGIFQLETFAQGTAAAKVKPKDFSQLTAVLAIARPGAISFLQQYCDYVHDGVYKSVHPLIDDILKPSGGVTLYQETYLAMLVRVGLTPEEAENARRVLGKKKVEEIPVVKAKITEVCERNGHPKEVVDLLLKIAEDSGGYSFNLSHAASYAIITARTLYLKANYPLQFYLALLRMARHEAAPHEVIAAIEQEMRLKGLTLLPPHFVKSGLDFQIETDKSIRYGLQVIRGVSDKNAEKLELFRSKVGAISDKFSLMQAIKNAGLNIGIGSALVQAGCMAGYDAYRRPNGDEYYSRSRLVLELCTFNLLTDAEKGHLMGIGALPEVGWDVLRGIKHLNEVAKNEKGKALINDRRFGTIKKRYQPYKEIYEQNSKNERLACYYYERRVLGYSFSETISDIFADHVDGLITVAEAQALRKDAKCRLIGFVGEKPEKGKTKKGNAQFRFTVRDETGEATLRAFNDRIDLIAEQNGGRLPQESDLIVANVKCTGDGGFFLEQGVDGVVCGIQSCAIYIKLSDLKDAKSKDAEAKQVAAAASEKPVLKEAA